MKLNFIKRQLSNYHTWKRQSYFILSVKCPVLFWSNDNDNKWIASFHKDIHYQERRTEDRAREKTAGFKGKMHCATGLKERKYISTMQIYKLLYREGKHCLAVRTQFSFTKVPPQICLFLGGKKNTGKKIVLFGFYQAKTSNSTSKATIQLHNHII